MLTPTEVARHNAKVAMRNYEKRVNANDPHEIIKDAERRAKLAKKKAKNPLPMIDPSKRPARKIYMGGKKAPARYADVCSAFPARNEVREYLRGERP